MSEKTVKLFTMKFVLLNYPVAPVVWESVDHSVNEDKEITKISVPPFFMLFQNEAEMKTHGDGKEILMDFLVMI